MIGNAWNLTQSNDTSQICLHLQNLISLCIKHFSLFTIEQMIYLLWISTRDLNTSFLCFRDQSINFWWIRMCEIMSHLLVYAMGVLIIMPHKRWISWIICLLKFVPTRSILVHVIQGIIFPVSMSYFYLYLYTKNT